MGKAFFLDHCGQFYDKLKVREFKMKLRKEEAFGWVASRRSVYPRMFESAEVSEQEILELLGVARWAPTHKLTQPWRFTVFTGAMKEKLARLQGEAMVAAKGDSEPVRLKAEKVKTNAQQSAAIIAIILHRDPEQRIPEFEETCAVACAVQNIWLSAGGMGLAGYWSTGAATNLPGIRSLLSLKETDKHLGWFYLGRFSGELPPRENRMEVGDYTTFFRE